MLCLQLIYLIVHSSLLVPKQTNYKTRKMSADDAWKTDDFRSKIVSKFSERIEEMEHAPERSSKELEERVSLLLT